MAYTDFIKEIDDAYGHFAGDAMLRLTAGQDAFPDAML
jgi:GGDEF domain-containing protein